MKKFISIFIPLFGVFIANAQITISSTGGTWNPVIDPTVIVDAGDDYPSDYFVFSDQSQTEINISPLLPIGLPLGLLKWNVSVSMTDVDLGLRLKLHARRSGNGDGTSIGNWLTGIIGPSISGGENYQEVTALPLPFFTGTAKYVDIPIQYKITGMSVLIPARTYTATVIYTYTGL